MPGGGMPGLADLQSYLRTMMLSGGDLLAPSLVDQGELGALREQNPNSAGLGQLLAMIPGVAAAKVGAPAKAVEGGASPLMKMLGLTTAGGAIGAGLMPTDAEAQQRAKGQKAATPPTQPGVPAGDLRSPVDVGNAQDLLVKHGFTVGAGRRDGTLGQDTRAAVRAYPKKAGMPETGTLDHALLQHLRDNDPTAAPKPLSPEKAAELAMKKSQATRDSMLQGGVIGMGLSALPSIINGVARWKSGQNFDKLAKQIAGGVSNGNVHPGKLDETAQAVNSAYMTGRAQMPFDLAPGGVTTRAGHNVPLDAPFRRAEFDKSQADKLFYVTDAALAAGSLGYGEFVAPPSERETFQNLALMSAGSGLGYFAGRKLGNQFIPKVANGEALTKVNAGRAAVDRATHPTEAILFEEAMAKADTARRGIGDNRVSGDLQSLLRQATDMAGARGQLDDIAKLPQRTREMGAVRHTADVAEQGAREAGATRDKLAAREETRKLSLKDGATQRSQQLEARRPVVDAIRADPDHPIYDAGRAILQKAGSNPRVAMREARELLEQHGVVAGGGAQSGIKTLRTIVGDTAQADRLRAKLDAGVMTALKTNGPMPPEKRAEAIKWVIDEAAKMGLTYTPRQASQHLNHAIKRVGRNMSGGGGSP